MPFKPNKTKATKKLPQKSGKVRVISGKFKGRKLSVIDAEGLRPSTDRIRETLFNWLMGICPESIVLDAFAGSGILAIESISRGADKAILIEQNPKVYEILTSNLSLLGTDQFELLNADALSIIPNIDTKFSLVFIDPPFHKNLVSKTLELLIEHQLLINNAYIYIEHEAQLNLQLPQNLSVKRAIETNAINAKLCVFNG